MLKIYAAGGKSKPLDIKNNAVNAQAEIEKAKYSGAKLVVLVGQKSAVTTMVNNDFEEKRYSALPVWLR